MKTLVNSILVIALSLFTFNAFAQNTTPAPDPVTFVKGNLNIRFNTKDTDNPPKGVTDTYKFDLNVSNSTKFTGTITQLPVIRGTLGSSYGAQLGNLTYDLQCDVMNPRNINQTRTVGKIYGEVPVSDKNVYDFQNGSLKTQVFQIGQARGFDSKFTGYALGKPPTPAPGILDRMKKEALSFTKTVNGGQMKISVTKYDIMQFNNHILAAGPVQSYTEATVNGQLVYDYDRASWYFQKVLVTYWVVEPNGSQHQAQDTISGDIRWVEDKNRDSNGLGEYDFDIRVNEPPPSENAVFSAPSTEDSFFETDTAAQGLSGTMKYKDTITAGTITKDNPDGNVTNSEVTIDLKGNKLSKQQTMYLTKLIMFSCVVPFNSE